MVLRYEKEMKFDFSHQYILCGCCGFRIGKGDIASMGSDNRWTHKECSEGKPRPKLKIIR